MSYMCRDISNKWFDISLVLLIRDRNDKFLGTSVHMLCDMNNNTF